MINTHPEIKQGLLTSFKEVIDWLQVQDDEKFEQGPNGKWETNQHLDHLMNVANTINTALRLPKFVIRFRFGKPNRKGRDYDTVVARYQEKLIGLPPDVAPGGKRHSLSEKSKLLSKFYKQGEKLMKSIDKWSEADLDNYLFPHPLLGKMTVRELLFWMTYHNYHHLNNLKQNY